MRRFLSPLRYPGGKEKLHVFIANLLDSQGRKRPQVYVEPFAGGAGAALALLHDEAVESVVLNDLNPGIAAFWRSCLYRTEEFVEKVMLVAPTIENWHKQRDIYLSGAEDDLELGFATFFLNRTNRSGIVHARPIGGLDQQGPWKIDARYSAERLASRIRLVASYRERIAVEEVDGRVFIEKISSEFGHRALLYADPPYIRQGEDLYMNNLAWRDHEELALTLRSSRSPWLVTYDRDDRVMSELYPRFRAGTFSISHSATSQRFGTEYFVVSDDLVVDRLDGFGPRSATWLR